MKYARIILVLLATASAAHAQYSARYVEYGRIHAKDTVWRSMDNGDSLGVATFENFGHLVSGDGRAFHELCSLSGIWRGSMWVLNAGACARIDADGDLLHTVWEMRVPGKAAAGVWHSTGGTGKYADLVCEGAYRTAASFETSDPDGGRSGDRWITEMEEMCRER